MTESPESLVDALRAQLTGQLREGLDARLPELAALAQEAADEGSVHVRAWPQGDVWELVVIAPDTLGALSLISGVFAVHSVNIVEGDIHTVRVTKRRRRRFLLPRPRFRSHSPPPKEVPVLFDHFVVRIPSDANPSELIDRIRSHLQRLLAKAYAGQLDAAREELVDRFAQVIARQPAPTQRLYPVRVEVDNDSAPDATVVRIESVDTLGFVFEFANALAMLRFNIVRVRVRTVDSLVRDDFWLTTQQGGKITDQAALADLRVAAVLIKQFTHLLPGAPNPAQALRQFGVLAREVLRWEDWVQRLRDLSSDEVLRRLAQVLGASEFLWEDFLRMQHETLFPVLANAPELERVATRAELEQTLWRELQQAPDWDGRVERLNRCKDREMFRIDLRHLTKRIDFAQFGRELTELAEAVVAVAVELARERVGPAAAPPMAVFGLGKLGGRELGFASDIELLFVHDASSCADEQERYELQQRADTLVREFTQLVWARREGVFHVDLRLRPFGNSGPLSPSVSFCADYYRHGGPAQQFERLALVKLRPIAGPDALASRVCQLRDDFVYSGQPVDRDNIIHLREKQIQELTQRGVRNAKYSWGGLVDVEYFTQARQIEAGAQDRSVRVTGTLEAIERLAAAGWLDPEFAATLADCYRFLRRLIDGLRVVRGNARDLNLPPEKDPEYRFLASRLGYDSAQLTAELERVFHFTANLWRTGEE